MYRARTSFDSTTEYYTPSLRQKYLVEGDQKVQLPSISSVPTKISWELNLDDFQIRSRSRLQAGNLEQTLPTGWPEAVRGPLVWSGQEYQDKKSYIYELLEDQKAGADPCAEIIQRWASMIQLRTYSFCNHNSVLSYPELSLDLPNVNKATFPLPTPDNELEKLSLCVHKDRGFFVLRGLNPVLFFKYDNIVLYMGVLSYIAE